MAVKVVERKERKRKSDALDPHWILWALWAMAKKQKPSCLCVVVYRASFNKAAYL